MTQNIPAERTVEGVGFQIVNVFHPVTGEHTRQLRHRGTVLQARAKAEQGFYHPVEDAEHWVFLRAIIIGEIPGTRAELLAHISSHAPCQMDDELAGALPETTDMQLAEHVWAAHLDEAHNAK
ncbi:hypothetical protein [Herbidospora mongoliensis]|uniref:hypothetical protein n=1 Tax=Herbidospora mongoliensis TaxID=688067 RepID=UPI00082CD1FB|nr:hypothetical protein [Herbidospora mongoliensis]